MSTSEASGPEPLTGKPRPNLRTGQRLTAKHRTGLSFSQTGFSGSAGDNSERRSTGPDTLFGPGPSSDKVEPHPIFRACL